MHSHRAVERVLPAGGASGLAAAAAIIAADTRACIDCSGGHGLQRFVSPIDGFTCSICGAAQLCGTTLYSCRLCDYDVCEQCAGHAEQQTSFAVEGSEEEESPGQESVGGVSPSLRSFPRPTMVVVHRTVSSPRHRLALRLRHAINAAPEVACSLDSSPSLGALSDGTTPTRTTFDGASAVLEPEPEPAPVPEPEPEPEPSTMALHHHSFGLQRTLHDLASLPMQRWNQQPHETPTVKMVVEMEPGAAVASDTIEIHQDDTPLLLAAQFVAKHSLKERIVLPLSQKIALEQASLCAGSATVPPSAPPVRSYGSKERPPPDGTYRAYPGRSARALSPQECELLSPSSETLPPVKFRSRLRTTQST